MACSVPDPYLGEQVKVIIVPREGEGLTGMDIVDYCKPGLATYRLPKIMEFRADPPKNMVRKVLRRLFREEERDSIGHKPGPPDSDEP